MMSGNGYQELLDLATFCLVVGIPYSDARDMDDDTRRAFTEAHNEIQEAAKKASRK